MIRIEKINAKNIWDILKLHVSKEQESYVAPNELSIIEAYVAITGNGHAFPFGIFENEIPVGFLMIGYDVDESFDNPPHIAYGNYSIWRLMIGEKYQNKGYGKEAICLALEFIRTFPCGKAEYCYLSYEPENVNAKRLYSEFGFIENGEMDDEEIVAVLKL
ncbi:MAG: GNAT family N-acetyltransferase [Blautia hansenii]